MVRRGKVRRDLGSGRQTPADIDHHISHIRWWKAFKFTTIVTDEMKKKKTKHGGTSSLLSQLEKL